MAKPDRTYERTRILHDRILISLRRHAIPAAKLLDADLRALIPGTAQIDTAATLSVVADALSARFHAFAKAQGALDLDLSETRYERDERDHVSITLRARLLDMSAALRLIHGPDALKRFKLAGRLPPSASDLLDFAAGFLDATAAGVDFNTDDDALVSADFAAMRDAIAALTETFRASLNAVRDEEHEDQSARALRDEALAAWTREARLARNLSRATLERVGRSALADRILPTNRQLNGNAPITPLSDEDSRFGA